MLVSCSPQAGGVRKISGGLIFLVISAPASSLENVLCKDVGQMVVPDGGRGQGHDSEEPLPLCAPAAAMVVTWICPQPLGASWPGAGSLSWSRLTEIPRWSCNRGAAVGSLGDNRTERNWSWVNCVSTFYRCVKHADVRSEVCQSLWFLPQGQTSFLCEVVPCFWLFCNSGFKC